MTAVAQGLVLAQRNFTRSRRNPASLVGSIVSPAIFFLGFYVVLKGVMEVPGFRWVDYLTPAVTVQAMLFAAMSSGFYVADDLQSGMYERTRSMPVSRLAPFIGRGVNDAIRAAVGVVVVCGLGAAFGFRFATVPSALAYSAVAIAFAVVLAAGAGLVGMVMSSPQATMETLMMPYLPLLMLSTAFVPAFRFPDWIEPFIVHQPVSRIADALRALSVGQFTTGTLVPALLWIAGLGICFASLAVRVHGGRR